MIEMGLDLWSYLGDADAIVITTNGFLTEGGKHAVLSTSSSREARDRFPAVIRGLAKAIRTNGNVVQLANQNPNIVAFPTRIQSLHLVIREDMAKILSGEREGVKVGDVIPGYKLRSDLELIKKSVVQLRNLADNNHWSKVAMPQVGCGGGDLNWDEDVLPTLESSLDDRFIVVHKW